MSKGMKIKVNLDKALIKNTVKRGSKRATWMGLDHLATVSKQQVPLDQGPLKNSCYVDVNDDGSQGTVSYDTPYAIPQHEKTWFQHQRGRKAKCLEDPCNDPTVQHEMADLSKKGFEGTM